MNKNCRLFHTLAAIIGCFLFMVVFYCPKSTASAEEPALQLRGGVEYIKPSLVSYEAQEDTLFVIACAGKRISVGQKPSGLSSVRAKIASLPLAMRKKVADFAMCVGYSLEQAVMYALPELEEPLKEVENMLFSPSEDAKISCIKGTGKIEIVEGHKGCKLAKKSLFKQIYYNLTNKNGEIPVIKAEKEEVDFSLKASQLKSKAQLRGSFKTSYASSSEERKSNIKKALSSVDGTVLKPGQSLSFNQSTGTRSEQRGYKRAKIIKNGVFVEEFGGGVCQASTTLYNCALLADLEIEEVHPHSLPVSYVEPCFDAMVNAGSSDLVIKNNTPSDIIICTSFTASECVVNIYGEKNPNKIVRKSQKTEELNDIETLETTDAAMFNKEPPASGESIVINSGKPGYRARGWIEYYQDGILVRTKQLGERTYLPTKRVVLVSKP